MGVIKDIFKYTGGINRDDEDRIVPKGDVRNALNVRSSTSDTDNSNSVNFVVSDLEINLTSVLPGSPDYTPLGYAEDIENNNVFVFYHSYVFIELLGETVEIEKGIIVKLNKNTNNLSVVLDVNNSITNFSKDHLINHANVIGDFLLWTDGYNPPRKINHVKALRFTESNGTDPEGYSVIDDQVISSVKLPPNESPHVFPKKKIIFQVAYTSLNEAFRPDPAGGVISLGILESNLSLPSDSLSFYSDNDENNISITFPKTDTEFNRGYNLYAKNQNTNEWVLVRKYENPNVVSGTVNITIGFNNLASLFNSNLNQSVFFDGDLSSTLTKPTFEADVTVDEDYVSTNLLDTFREKQKFYFATSYVYTDFEPSTVSPYSTTPFRFQDFSDVLSVRFSTGHPNVRSIILYSKRGDDGNWFRVKRIDKYDSEGNVLIESDSTHTYDFNATELFEGVDQADFARPFDYVPLKAKCQELLNTGNLVYANYLEGYDSVDVDMNISVIQDNGLLPNKPFVSYDVEKISNNNFFLYNFQLQDYDGGDIPILSVINFVEGFEYFYQGISFDIIEDMAKLSNTEAYSLNGNDGVLITTKYSNNTLDWISKYEDYPTFKSGGKYKIGVMYSDDANRSTVVNIDRPNNDIIIPFFNHNNPFPNESGVYKTWYRNLLKWEIKSKPPEWATRYQIVYTDCLNVAESFYVSATGETTNSEDDEISDVSFDYYYDPNTEERIDDYTFQEGDKVRFIAYADDNYSSSSFELFDNYIEVDLLGYDTSSKVFNVRKSDYPTGTGQTRYKVEIFRPIKESQNVIYRERGLEYEIGNPGSESRYHKGHLSNQSPSNLETSPATGIIIRGDFFKRRVRVKEGGAFVSSVLDESKSISTKYYNNLSNKGRLNIQSDSLQQKWFKAGLRHGGKFIENTQVNNLSRFDFNDKIELSEKYGSISKTIEVGFTLKALQQYNVSSIYIGRTQTLDSEGQTNLALTNTIFGTVNPSTDNYGCEHPESVRKDHRNLYFFDVNNGLVIRNSPNGSVPISDYKMVSYFRNKAKETLSNESIKVIGNIDKEYKEYVLSFVGSSNDETIAFHERENRWKTFYSYTPEGTANIGDQAYVLIGDKIYKLNAGDTYGNLTGNQNDMEIEFIMNESPQKVKVFESVAVNSNLPFSLPEITVPAKQSNNNQVRQSRLIESKFERKEGVYYAELLKDLNTPNFSTELLALINGDEMRGQSIKFKLIYQGEEAFVMDSFLLHANPSELSL